MSYITQRIATKNLINETTPTSMEKIKWSIDRRFN